MLMNGKGPYGSFLSYESFNVTKGKTYRFRVSNVGSTYSFNFRIENHTMLLVETEGSYINQMSLNSLDVHVGQSYSVLVTTDKHEADYFVVASPILLDPTNFPTLVAKGILHYDNSLQQNRRGEYTPPGPDPFDTKHSLNQAKSIRWNLTSGASRFQPQGSFNVQKVKITKTFIFRGSKAVINGLQRHVINNVSYATPNTPLKLADYFANGRGVFKVDAFPSDYVSNVAQQGVFVASAIHKGYHEFVFENELDEMDSWHLDGFAMFVVGYGDGEWTNKSRKTYNLYDPVVRTTVQVYPRGWTATIAYLDNPGMWNLRSQHMKNWYTGEELYVRVHDEDPHPEEPPPQNLITCGIFKEKSWHSDATTKVGIAL